MKTQKMSLDFPADFMNFKKDEKMFNGKISKIVTTALTFLMVVTFTVTATAQVTSQTAVQATGVGSWGDVTCREFWQEYDKIAGTKTVIHNRPGAGGILAAQSLISGESQFWCTASGELVYSAISDKPQDFLKIVEPIGVISWGITIIYTAKHPSIRSAGELKQLTLQSSGPIKVGVLSETHKNMIDYLVKKHGFRMITVPYKSGQEAVPDLTTGNLDFFLSSVGLVPMSKPWNPEGILAAYAYIVNDDLNFKSKNVTVWANLGKEYPNLNEFVPFIGISVPKNMPHAEKEKFSRIFDQIVREGKMTQNLSERYQQLVLPGHRINAAEVERLRATLVEIIK